MTTSERIVAPETYFGAAVNHDPVELYDKIGRPTPNKVPYAVSEVVSTQFYSDPVINHNFRLLSAGIRDSQAAFINAFAEHGHIDDRELANSIVTNDQTIATLSFLASHYENKIDRINTPRIASKYYKINETATAIMATDRLLDTSGARGCPHAKSEKDELPTKLFERFVRWSGTMAVELYFDYYRS